MIIKIYQAVIKRHWWVIGSVAALFSVLEYLEPRASENRIPHLLETLVYLIILLLLGILIDMLWRANNSQYETLKILDFKHRINQEFSAFESWDDLTQAVARLPSRVVEAGESLLYIRNEHDDSLELEASWRAADWNEAFVLKNLECELCMQRKVRENYQFSQCAVDNSLDGSETGTACFCLPLIYGNDLFGMLRFQTKTDEPLTEGQAAIFKNIGDDLALVLKASQDRKIFHEMRMREASKAERRSVSIFLHDNLGQNLSYLRLKLDQLISEYDTVPATVLLTDLQRMREAANDSYEIVRGTLEKNYPKTIPFLDKLIAEQSQKWSQRANLDVHLTNIGQPSPITSDVQRAVFYVFQEALSNVEKHAKASSVEVNLNWCDEQVSLKVTDNGTGFNPQNIDFKKHFGVEIMRERIENVKGQLSIQSAENFGTTVTIVVPTQKIVLT